MARQSASTDSEARTFEAGLLEAVQQAVIVTDLDWTITYWNRFAETLYGWPSIEALGRNIGELIVPETSEADSQNLMPRLLQGQSWSGEFVVRRRDGTSFPCLVTDSPLRDSSGVLVGVIGVSIDITARSRADEAQARLAAIVTSSDDAIIAKDLHGTITDWNRAAEVLYGYTAAEIVGQPVSVLMPPEHAAEAPEFLARIAGGESLVHFETVRLRKDGRRLDMSVSITPIRARSGAIVGAASIGHDIGRRKEADGALAHQAQHDGLTGLPNRRALHTRLQEALVAQRSADPRLALLLLDLDRFKEVNDTLGHQAGDVLLKQLGQRLKGAVRTADLVGRLGGDEFAVLLPGTDAAGAAHVANSLVQVLQAPFVLEGQPIVVDASIGIAIAPEHGQDADTLLRCADVAMYQAKRAGTGVALYCSAKDQHRPDGLALLGTLRHAIDHDELLLHYQPKLDLRDGSLVGVEALVRWQHPQRGFLAPSEFIPLAEQTGLIYPLSRWVLNAALKQQQVWHAAGIHAPVAVNLSRRSLHDSELPVRVAEALARWDVAPDSLVLEITESSLMADPISAAKNLNRLRALGVRISIDDFGTGYSSLASLKNLSVDELKIDQSFVQAMAADASSRAIVRSIIDLADALKLRVVAEGVEDKATWDVLAGLGCDIAQGYFVSRPISAAELATWVRTLSPKWLTIAQCSQAGDALQERIRGRGARLTAEEEFVGRKRAEAALLASEERNRVALHGARMGTWDFDLITRVITCSPETETLHGLAPGTFQGTYAALRRAIHPADWPSFEIDQRAAVAEQRDSMSAYRVILKDGSVHWIESRGRGQYALDGTPLRISGTVVDITERKLAEARDQLLTIALEASANAVVLTDGRGCVEWANPAFTDLTGYSLPEALGQSTRLLKSGVQDTEFYRDLWDTILTGATWHGELINRRKDGSLYTEEMTITPVRDATGEIAHFVAIKQDVTARKQMEAALHTSEERNRLALSAASMGTWDWDVIHDVTSWSTEMEAIHGLGPGTFEGTFAAFQRTIHPEDWPAFQIEMKASKIERRNSIATYRAVWPDGSVRWLENQGRAIYAADGTVMRVNGTSMDITERKQAEAALSASEERFRTQYMSFPLPTYSWLTVGDDFVLQDFNDAADADAAGHMHDWLGEKASTMYAGQPEIVADLRLCATKRRTLRRETSYQYQASRQGRELVVSYVFVPPQTVMVHTEDVTQAKQAQAQAEEERATLAAVMGSMTDGLLVLGGAPGAGLLFANARAAELVGVEQESLSTMTAAMVAVTINGMDNPAATMVAWEHALAHLDERPSFEATLHGSPPRGLLVQLFEIPAPGGVPGRVGILLRDVTAERDLMRTKDELVSVVSHELRTPLASVLGFAELLRDREYPEPRRRKFLNVIIDEGRRLTALINDFLDLQRLASPDRQQPALNSIALQPVVELATSAAGADVERPVILHMADDLPQVCADADRLKQVLGNLLSNARKYSPAGGSIHVSASQDEVDGPVWISIRDAGLGIPPAALPHLFEKFYRVDNSDRRSIKGTGLGLAICKQIVEGQGGSIRAQSEGVGRGSTFSFSLRTAHPEPTVAVADVPPDLPTPKLAAA